MFVWKSTRSMSVDQPYSAYHDASTLLLLLLQLPLLLLYVSLVQPGRAEAVQWHECRLATASWSFGVLGCLKVKTGGMDNKKISPIASPLHVIYPCRNYNTYPTMYYTLFLRHAQHKEARRIQLCRIWIWLEACSTEKHQQGTRTCLKSCVFCIHVSRLQLIILYFLILISGRQSRINSKHPHGARPRIC